MKARVAAATKRVEPGLSSGTPAAQNRQSGPRQGLQQLDDGGRSGRGGLGIGLHPMLMGDAGQDAKRKKFTGPKFGTTMGNRRTSSPAQPDKGKKKEDQKENPYLDDSAVPTAGGPKARQARHLQFHEKGKYIAQAAAIRRQANLEAMKRQIAESTRKAGLDEDRTEQAFLVKDVPNVEWWDEGLLIETSAYPDFVHESAAALESKLKIEGTEDTIVTRYIQHPVPIDPPQENLSFQPKAMYLTHDEQKKLRRQKRMEDLKEKQAKIRLGLEPPEPPKIKKSNLMRVLGEQAVKDPTAVEALVTKEISERKEKHEKDNEERKLTKDERHEKQAANQEKDAAKGLVSTVYRIDSLAYNKNRNKIDMNAKQFKDLTGVMLTNPRVNLVVIEAGQHTTSFIKKLLTRRIKWTENAPSTAPPVEAGAGKEKAAPPAWLSPEDESGRLKDLSGNKCVLLWEGELKSRAFRKWSERDCETDGEARQFLERSKMENVWMLAKDWAV